MKTHTRCRHDNSDAAILKRGWRLADALMAGLLALVGLAGQAMPDGLSLSGAVRRDALKQVRRLEALVRRLVLAIAAETRWPPARPASQPVAQRPPCSVRIVLPFDRLGLARHWRPQAPDASAPEPDAPSQVTRKPVAPTFRLAEPWPGDRVMISDQPFPKPGQSRLGPRILDLSQPYPAPAPPRHVAPRSAPDGAGLVRRIVALRAVIADPSRMVRRMTRWLAARGDKRDRAFRPYPLCIVPPGRKVDPDLRSAILCCQDIARARLVRRDSS